MSSAGVQSVEAYTTSFEKLLAEARGVKPDGGVEPALKSHHFGDNLDAITKRPQTSVVRDYAAIETACRNIFYGLVASTAIEDAAFGELWNLFDVLSILSDLEQCEPSLLFWLVEELLDTQTIDGCRTVFDYLDSRREVITAKHFKQKQLIILRACNELLRRLSRAEDTVFCGRVFIFLFQSFPLGDRSSVNLRGEFHTENVTVFENSISSAQRKLEDDMDVDLKEENSKDNSTISNKANVELQTPAFDPSTAATAETLNIPKGVKLDPKDEKRQGPTPEKGVDPVLDMDSLYPKFWSLQEYFSTPTKLFEDLKLESLKNGLESTMRKFKDVHQELSARGPSKLPDDGKRGVKRKRNGQEDELAASFNPKYLTSRDLFELEISDLAFRRHILVQALILVDFLLSLTPKAKMKLEKSSNKSVLYNYALSETNAKWAIGMRNEIASYLQQGPEGKFYYRMVDTVLSRDKNWVHWKAEGCPLIQREPISAEDFAEAEIGATKACSNKKLRATPMGTLDLTFLSDSGDMDGMEKLKHVDRYSVPAAESFQRPIADDEFEIDMARSDTEKRAAIDARASKLWRTLRIASKNKLSLFDKIDDGHNLKALFEPDAAEIKERMDVNGLDEHLDPSIRVTDVVETAGKPPDENRLDTQMEIAVT